MVQSTQIIIWLGLKQLKIPTYYKSSDVPGHARFYKKKSTSQWNVFISGSGESFTLQKLSWFS